MKTDPHAGPPWLAIARRYLGLAEGRGVVDNPRVVAFYALAGHPEVHRDSVPWCAAFVGGVLHMAGLPNSGTLWALDYARYGQKLAGPALGAIATKTRVGGGHVFFVAGWTDTEVLGLGGNQNDAVSLVSFRRAAVESYAWPPGVALPEGAHTLSPAHQA